MRRAIAALERRVPEEEGGAERAEADGDDQHPVARRQRDRRLEAATWQSEREQARDQPEQADRRGREVRRRGASAASSWPR